MSDPSTQNQTPNSSTPHVTICVAPGSSTTGNALVPASPTNSLSKSLSDAGVSIHLSTEDVLAVRLAAEERKLNKLIGEAQGRLKLTQKAIATLDETVAALINTYMPTEDARDRGHTLRNAMSYFYGVEFIEVYTREMREDREYGVHARTTLAVKPKLESHLIPDNFINEIIPATAEHLDLLRQRVARLQEVADIEGEIQKYRRGLANLPALARQARAQLVSAVIGNTSEGQRLIDSITCS